MGFEFRSLLYTSDIRLVPTTAKNLTPHAICEQINQDFLLPQPPWTQCNTTRLVHDPLTNTMHAVHCMVSIILQSTPRRLEFSYDVFLQTCYAQYCIYPGFPVVLLSRFPFLPFCASVWHHVHVPSMCPLSFLCFVCVHWTPVKFYTHLIPILKYCYSDLGITKPYQKIISCQWHLLACK